MVGDSKTGKSNIYERFRNLGKWDANLYSTIGVEIKKAIVPISNKKIILQLWDSSGAERFQSVTRGCYPGTSGALIVYDITNRDSFLHVHDWLKSWREFKGREVQVFLVGNKCDLEDEREVSYEEGRLLAEENEMRFVEVSAKTQENINYLFRVVAKELVAKFIRQENTYERTTDEKYRFSEKKKEEDVKSRCNIW